MKLISCYIENFGGLSGYSLDFSPDITVVQERNGFGKTTLAEFLRAMFYGFPRKSKDLDKSLRQKYMPWQGGTFGGNLVFEAEGRRYRIERTFGDTPRKDTFRLVDLETGLDSSRYSEEIGLELFQLDGDSFERSTYLPQSHDLTDLTTDSIQAKLGDLVEDTNDIGNFEKAMQSLRTQRSALKPYRGSGGALAEAQGNISQLQSEIASLKLRKDVLTDLEAAVATLEGQIRDQSASLEELRGRIGRAAEQQADREIHRSYAALCDQVRQTRQQLEELNARYPVGIPAQQEIEAAQQASQQLALLEKREVTNSQDLAAQKFFNENHERFAWGVPTAEEIENCRDRMTKAQMCRREAEMLDHQATKNAEKKAFSPGLLVGAVLATAVLAAVMLLGKMEILYGAALLAALWLGVGIVQICRRREQQRTADRVLSDAAAKRAEADSLAEAVESHISRFRSEKTVRPTKPEGYLRELAALQTDIARYVQAVSRVEEWQIRQQNNRQEIAACRNRVNAFAERCGGNNVPFREMLVDLGRQKDLTAQLARQREQAEAYRVENAAALARELPEEPLNLQVLRQEEQSVLRSISERTRLLLAKKQEQQELRRQLEQIPELEDALESWQQKKQTDTQHVSVLDTTMDLLQKSRDRLSCKYLGAVGQRFAWYMEQLMGEQQEHIRVDTSLMVQLERRGIARDLAYFSAGQEDLVMLCMRFALVDALFTGEQPFVILDDPFVNLDDAHTAQAVTMLEKLGQQRQILYLTCHSSRTL